MAADKLFRTRLDPVPDVFKTDLEVWRFLNQLRERVGGNSGDYLYNAAQDGATAAALEPLIFAISQEVENRVEGAVRSIIEQIQEQSIDLSGLLTDTQDIVLEPGPPEDFPLAGIIQAARDNSPVLSVFGRQGAIIATEGDYSLTLLSDVTITTPALNQVLSYNGSQWVNTLVPAAGLSGIVGVVNGGTGQSSLTANSVILGNGTSPVSFVAPGTTGNVLTSNGTTWTSSAPAAAAPQFETFSATAGQTVFNTTIPTIANGSGRNYLMVTLNGLVMEEGAGNDYTVTGANQITFTFALALNDAVTMRAFA